MTSNYPDDIRLYDLDPRSPYYDPPPLENDLVERDKHLLGLYNFICGTAYVGGIGEDEDDWV